MFRIQLCIGPLVGPTKQKWGTHVGCCYWACCGNSVFFDTKTLDMRKELRNYPAAVGEIKVPSVMRKPPGVDL